MEFELPIGVLIVCLSLSCGWFSGNPIFYIWISVGSYLIYKWIKNIFKEYKKQKG